MENKTSKYIKYAIGEIILVVIGILIALQINNWQAKYKSKLEEQKILTNLNSEFKQNKKELKNAIIMNQNCLETGRHIMSLIGEDNKELNSINTDSLLFQGFEYAQFNPSENTLSDLLQSGRLNLITNDYLKSLLYQWSRANKGIQDQFSGVDDKIELDLVTYLTENYALKDVDSYGRLNWKTRSKLPIDKTKIFSDIKYENLMDDLLYRLSGYNLELKKVDRIFTAIIKETHHVESK